MENICKSSWQHRNIRKFRYMCLSEKLYHKFLFEPRKKIDTKLTKPAALNDMKRKYLFRSFFFCYCGIFCSPFFFSPFFCDTSGNSFVNHLLTRQALVEFGVEMHDIVQMQGSGSGKFSGVWGCWECLKFQTNFWRTFWCFREADKSQFGSKNSNNQPLNKFKLFSKHF